MKTLPLSTAWEAGPLAFAASARRRPTRSTASQILGRRRRPLLFRAPRRTGELVLEVPGRLAVAHHDDRGLLARALAQRALRGAEQHDATLWLLELRLLRALRCSKVQFWGKRA